MINVYEKINKRLTEDGFYEMVPCANSDTLEPLYLCPHNDMDEHIEDAIGRYLDEMMIEHAIVSETLFENCSYEIGYVAVSYLDECGRPNLDTWTYEVR